MASTLYPPTAGKLNDRNFATRLDEACSVQTCIASRSRAMIWHLVAMDRPSLLRPTLWRAWNLESTVTPAYLAAAKLKVELSQNCLKGRLTVISHPTEHNFWALVRSQYLLDSDHFSLGGSCFWISTKFHCLRKNERQKTNNDLSLLAFHCLHHQSWIFHCRRSSHKLHYCSNRIVLAAPSSLLLVLPR
jgi:hypothetical protein